MLWCIQILIIESNIGKVVNFFVLIRTYSSDVSFKVTLAQMKLQLNNFPGKLFASVHMALRYDILSHLVPSNTVYWNVPTILSWSDSMWLGRTSKLAIYSFHIIWDESDLYKYSIFKKLNHLPNFCRQEFSCQSSSSWYSSKYLLPHTRILQHSQLLDKKKEKEKTSVEGL